MKRNRSGKALERVVGRAQEHMRGHDIDGWLLYDYRGINPIFWETVGRIPNVTRPCWMWVPARGEPRLVVSFVDQGRFAQLGIATTMFVSRSEMVQSVAQVLAGSRRVAMEYSPEAELPRVSRVDAGTLELVRGLGVEVVSSGDTVQYAALLWDEEQLESHRAAAQKLSAIVTQAFAYIGEDISTEPTEYEVAEFIRRRFVEEGMVATDGPVVAVNEHSSDPHFDPTPDAAVAIKPGDWVLIDLWSRLAREDAMFADITWTAYVGGKVPEPHQRVFDTVIGARDAALAELERASREGQLLEGWQLDQVARDFIARAGYGDHFNHRLGHSLGREAHGNAVNLDGWETRDSRHVIPGVAVTIEPGIYLSEFGVRSEINVYISEDGPEVTTEVQRAVVLIGG